MTAPSVPFQVDATTSTRPVTATAIREEALHEACSKADLSKLRTLVVQQASENPDSLDVAILKLLAQATKKRQTNVIQLLLKHLSTTDFDHDLIYSAIGDIGIYKLYLAKTPRILTYEWQGVGDAVCCAVCCKRTDFLSFLLSIGADPGRSIGSARAFYRYLLLEVTAMNGYASIARLLIEHGAIVRGTEAVQLAAEAGQLAMVRLLIEAGGDMNAIADPDGPFNYYYYEPYGTPLIKAVSNGHVDVVQFLLERGAEVEKPDTAGQTALARAQAVGNPRIVELLQAHV